jgi:hypothetical protein
MNIAAADAACRNLDQKLIGTWHRDGKFCDLEFFIFGKK